MNKSRSIKIAALATAITLAFAPVAQAATWKAGGASSVNGLMAACKTKYQAATGDDFPYNGTGSGSGKTGVHNGTMDFAFSDSFDTAPVDKQIQAPAFVWPVAILTNTGGSNKPLTLSTETIAKIFAGKITRWDDEQIVADNNRPITTIIYAKNADGSVKKDAKGAPVVLRTQTLTQKRILPAKPITVFYRSATSGTSNNLTNAFNKLYPSIWTKPANDAFATAFPGDITANPQFFRGATGSGDVANGVKATPYSITYAEVGFAKAPYNLAITKVINAAGNAIVPSSDSAMAAAAQATVAADGKVTFAYDSKDSDAYPFTATTYALAVAGKSNSADIAKTLNYLSNNCAKDNPAEGFGAYSATNAFAKAFQAQLAKLK
ncbi:PstS ABC-type phosphate transport system, periplasmic component [Candidatus Nanopelagicaceae bacterium]